MTRKCSVESCKSDSNRIEDAGVTFHKVPLHPDLRPKWLSLCRIPEDKKNIKIIYVCSRHFLRADFCNFKGRKYMLRQGVLPSVFPWDKSKLEAIKAEVQIRKDGDLPKEISLKKVLAKTIKKEAVGREKKSLTFPEDVYPQGKTELAEVPPVEIKTEIKEEIKSNFDEQLKIAQESSTDVSASNSMINFVIDSKVQVLDNQSWYIAKINEVDYDENEVLIHFENEPNKCNEWISMTSSRLRPVQEAVMESMQIDIKIPELTENAPPQPNITESAAKPGQQPTTIKAEEKFEFEVGERVMAAWSDSRKFPATINKKLENGAYEVLFDDGYIKAVKPNRIAKVDPTKLEVKPTQSCSPLFEPVKSTKQERREKKRKINVAELFQKRPKLSLSNERKSRDNSKDSPSRGASTPSINSADESTTSSPMMSPPQLVAEAPVVIPDVRQAPETPTVEAQPPVQTTQWCPTWIDGVPVGEESHIETADGLKKSIILPDPRLPTGWAKHVCQRMSGSNAGKWDVIFKGPDNKKFRSRNEINNYLEIHPEIDANIGMFDFSLHGRTRKQAKPKAPKKIEKSVDDLPPILENAAEPPKLESPMEVDAGFNLKIVYDNGVFRCPLEGCGKQFRRENLALMHVKHYHAEYSKYLESMPNVADLAYARTVGESLDTSPVPQKVTSTRNSLEKSTPKIPKVAASSPQPVQNESTNSLPVEATVESEKEAEIIRILNKALLEEAETQQAKRESPKSDIKLIDLLSKPSEIPNKDENYLRTLSASTRTPSIKTLLPVRSTKSSPEVKQEVSKLTPRPEIKRKLSYMDIKETSIPKHPMLEVETSHIEAEASTGAQEVPTLLEPMEPSHPKYDGVIVENGRVIKLERMKQEEIINCLCGITEEDGLMIQCELCLCWQHAYCNNIVKETEVPEKYICYICQNPLLERRSYRYLHDQEWLKQGVLPTTSFHTKDKEALTNRFEKLKKCHNISGGLLEMRDYVHMLGVKLSIAESKNHPKLYLWSKSWGKPKLPEKCEVKDEINDEEKPKLENGDHQYIKNHMDIDKNDLQNDSILSMILKAGKEDSMLNMTNNIAPIILQAEAVIDTDDCRLNLLDHISHSSSLIEERLDDFERQLDELEKGVNNHDLEESSLKTKHTIQLLLKDLGKLKQFSEVPMI